MIDDVERLMRSYPQIYFACHRRHVRDDERGVVLTAQQANILDHLMARRRTTLSQLARHLGVSDSTASIGITRLVQDGYTMRARDSADKRQVLLTLTEAGTRVVEENSVLDRDEVGLMLRLLKPSQRDAAIKGLEALASAAQELLRRRERRRRK